MAKLRRTAVRGSWLPAVLMGVTALGLLSVAGVAVAWAMGAFADQPAAEPIDRTGQLAFPAIVRPMNAYEAITKDDFINPQTKQLNVVWLPEATAQVASRNMAELIGRVLRRDKQAGMVLSEADFLEKGTRPGLVAGIPAGKLAIAIPATGIPGLEQLRGGDRFDLLVSLPKRDNEELISNSEPAALFGGIKPTSLRVGQLSQRHGVKHLITDGMLVTLFSGASRSTSGPSGLTVTPGGSKSAATQAVFAELAVEPEEIDPLTEAISLGTKMTCVLRSGLPNGKVEDAMSTEGMVPVITTATAVKAFSALSDENLMDEATGQLHFYYFAPDKISEEWIVDPAELYGRVVGRSLRRGSLITESDLLPKGTRPGISAGLPSGMAAMSIDKSLVQGFEKLVVGDTFAILTRVPEGVGGSVPGTTWATVYGGKLSREDERLETMVRTGIREVAKSAIYLSDPDDTTVVIGVPENDVARIAQLIRDKSDVFVIANSSRDGLEQKAIQQPPFPDPAAIDLRPNAAPVFVSRNAFVLNQDLEEEDQLSFPVLIQEVPAYRALRIEDFVDPATGQIRRMYFPRESVQPDWQSDIRKLIDRTTLRELRPGRVVTAGDLAPEGLPAGPALGVPAGMRGVTVNSSQLAGLATLSPGTRFDIVTAHGVAVSSLGDTVRASISSEDAVRESAKQPSGSVSVSRIIAENAVLVANVGEVSIVVNNVQRKTETQLQPDGSTVTVETVIDDPTSVMVEQSVIAVPEAFLGEFLGLLNAGPGLFASLRPVTAPSAGSDVSSESENAHSPSSTAKPAAPVRAVITEHVRGEDIRSEVFLTDRPIPNETKAKIVAPDESQKASASDADHEEFGSKVGEDR
jgi:flagella basal body P-ring formation protein FlgA